MSSHGQGGALVIGGASGIGAATVALYREQAIPVTVWDVQGRLRHRTATSADPKKSRIRRRPMRRWRWPGSRAG